MDEDEDSKDKHNAKPLDIPDDKHYDKHDIDESLIINRFYFEALKDQFNCPICLCLLSNPLMCSNCETTFCKKCITIWLTKNDTCPMRCPKNQSTVININRTIKKNLDGLKLRCKYGCEVPFLSYEMHVRHSHKDDIKCWNCEKISNKNSIKQVKEDNSKVKIKELIKTITTKEEQILILNNDLEQKNKELFELKSRIASLVDNKNKEKERESLILKAKNEDLEAAIKLKEKEINVLNQKNEEQTQALKPKKGEINQLKNKIEDYEEALKLFFSQDLLREQIKIYEVLQKKLKEVNDNPCNPGKKMDLTNLTNLYNNKIDHREALKTINLSKIEMDLERLKLNEVDIKDSLAKLVRNKSCLTNLKCINIHHVPEVDEQERPIEKIQTTFKNIKKVTTKDYQFFNENKTIRKMRENKIGIYCTDKVKMEGIQEFSIKIDSINLDKKIQDSPIVSILFGFTVTGTCPLDGFHNTKTSWMCCLNSGGFYNAGDIEHYFVDKNKSWIKPNIGDIYGICFDSENDEMLLKKNGVACSPRLQILINKKQKKSINPCVDILLSGCAVTII